MVTKALEYMHGYPTNTTNIYTRQGAKNKNKIKDREPRARRTIAGKIYWFHMSNTRWPYVARNQWGKVSQPHWGKPPEKKKHENVKTWNHGVRMMRTRNGVQRKG